MRLQQSLPLECVPHSASWQCAQSFARAIDRLHSGFDTSVLFVMKYAGAPTGQRIDPPPRAVGFWQAFAFWLKLGFISFGGPAGQIAIMHKVATVGSLLWAIPMGVLMTTYGWHHTLTQMGGFFTKAALLTFGGAYAVLPYVYQGAVGHYGWLTPAQMIDGLALGETTPGPLIMVVAFVGFVGGYVKALFGQESLFLAGAAAATLVTGFTFLPSFLFILAGGPLVESTHGDIKFTAPLTAITAAVVGVILNLALFFSAAIPNGQSSPALFP